MNDIATIQNCSNQSKISEYKNLVNFLFSKLGPIQINKVKHICYWKDSASVQVGSTATKTEKTEKGGNNLKDSYLVEVIGKLIGFFVMLIILYFIGEILSLFLK
jgi:hypothetical protein